MKLIQIISAMILKTFTCNIRFIYPTSLYYVETTTLLFLIPANLEMKKCRCEALNQLHM